MHGKLSRSAIGVALVSFFLLFAGCSGGGGDGGTVVIFITSVNPSVSTDLTGGDRVTVVGRNFGAFTIISVTFAGAAGTNMQVMNGTTIEVTTPPAPNGQAGFVGVEINAVDGEGVPVMAQLPLGYQYQGAGGGSPNPQTINPTQYTPTGAAPFIIQGTNLGPGGGQVAVTFAGIGTVNGQVSQDATLVTGNAPVPPAVPAGGLITVTIDTGTQQANVPTQVQYNHQAPLAIPLLNQTAGGASQPVRIADDAAVVCSAGGDGVWGNADDAVMIVQGPKGNLTATFILRPNGSHVGFLDANNSIPVALDAGICIFSPGTIIHIADPLSANPVVTSGPLASGINAAPLARISATRIAFTSPAPGGGGGNVLWVMEFTALGAGGALNSGAIGTVDATPGRANKSIPFSPDGEEIFVYTSGPDATFGNFNDQIHRFTYATVAHINGLAANLAGPPTAINGNLLAAPDPGADGTLGTGNDDRLAVFTPTGGAISTSFQALPSDVNATAAVLAARIGAGGIAIPVVGVDGAQNSNDDEVCIFTDPVAGTLTALPFPRVPLLVPLGSGDLHVFGLGLDGAAGSGDERVTRVVGDATTSQTHLSLPIWNQGFVPLTDQTRTFAVNAANGALLVYQTLALGGTFDATTLPASDIGNPVVGTLPFVPVGPDWGLVQSPGADAVFGTADDSVLAVCY